MNTTQRSALAAAVFFLAVSGGGVRAQQTEMTFFVTSVGSGKGADLRGLEGADRHCQSLAQAAPGKTWRA